MHGMYKVVNLLRSCQTCTVHGVTTTLQRSAVTSTKHQDQVVGAMRSMIYDARCQTIVKQFYVRARAAKLLCMCMQPTHDHTLETQNLVSTASNKPLSQCGHSSHNTAAQRPDAHFGLMSASHTNGLTDR